MGNDSLLMAKASEAKGVDSASPIRPIQPVREGSERDLNALRKTVQMASSNGSGPSGEGIAEELIGMPPAERASVMRGLQQTHGNRYAGRLAVQAKLKIGAPGDKYEQEADRVAEAVMRWQGPEVQRQPVKEEEEEEKIQTKPIPDQIKPLIQRQIEPEEEEEEEKIQTKPIADQIKPLIQRQVEEEEQEEEKEVGILQPKLTVGGQNYVYEKEARPLANTRPANEEREIDFSPDPKGHIQAKGKTHGSLRTSSHLARCIQSTDDGSPMSQHIRKRIEHHIGKSLKHVRVHNDKNAHDAAQSIHAKAFTHKNHIYLGRGQSSDDLPLLAHESVHVIQQESSSQTIGSRSFQSVRLVPQIQRRDDNLANTTNSNKISTASDTFETSSSTEALQQENESRSVIDFSGEEPEVWSTPEGETIGSDLEEVQTGEAAELGAEERELGAETETSGGPAEERAEAIEREEDGGGEPRPPQGSLDLDLIDTELAEHERWAGSFGEMGTAGSDQRARFLMDQAGEGLVSGAVGGAGMAFAMGAIGAGVGQIAGRRLATLAISRGFPTPVPGLGSAIGGVMAVAGLAMRVADWSATSETIGRMGTGEGYEGLANDLEGIAEILDFATQIADAIAGVLGVIAVGMWVAAVLSAGTLSPLAASFSAIALYTNLATTAIGVINSAVIRPTVTALRALHTFESQGDPSQIEAEGRQLQVAAGQVSGSLAGAAAGSLGGVGGRRSGVRADRAVTRWQKSRTGGRPERSAVAGPGPRIHVEVPEAPTGTASGTTPKSPSVSPPAGLRLHTKDRAAAIAQYHEQVRANPGLESAVWLDANGNYHVLQGEPGGVRLPSGPGEAIYHNHPTKIGAAEQGLMSQPSQARGDLGVLQSQYGIGSKPGRRQTSELHFPVYDSAGVHTGYGTTRFVYDPTHPLPLQVQTTLPGGRPSTQRYASFADYQRRAQVGPGGRNPAEAAAAFAAAENQLSSDITNANQRIETFYEQSRKGEWKSRPEPIGIQGVREGRELGRHMILDEAQAEDSSDRPERGPAYTISVPGIRPGESIDIPINPAYPEPPGTRAELDLLLERIGDTQEAQSELERTERSMGSQAEVQRTHEAQLDEAQTVVQDLAAGRSNHQEAVDSTQSTNIEQQSTAGEAISSLGRGAEESAALYTLVGSLRVFQGLAHLFTYLPGDLGRRAEGAREDASRLITTLNRVSETDSVQSGVEVGRRRMVADSERIDAASAEGQQTDAEIGSGQDQIVELQQANAESLSETESVLQQATQERSEAVASENEAQTAYDSLERRLQAWAQAHRQAREVAIQDAVSRYRELGYRAREER